MTIWDLLLLLLILEKHLGLDRSVVMVVVAVVVGTVMHRSARDLGLHHHLLHLCNEDGRHHEVVAVVEAWGDAFHRFHHHHLLPSIHFPIGFQRRCGWRVG